MSELSNNYFVSVAEIAAKLDQATRIAQQQRWMPSNEAKNDWVKRVRKLDIEMMCPQHGRIFKGDNVKRFLDWFEALEVGLIAKAKTKE